MKKRCLNILMSVLFMLPAFSYAANKYEIRSIIDGIKSPLSKVYNSTPVYIKNFETWSWCTTYGVGSGKSMLDKSYNYGSGGILNCLKGKTQYVSGVLDVSENANITKIRYDFASDGTNVNKKMKYIDIYTWNGTSFVLGTTLKTKNPVVGAPEYEYFDLPTPIKLHDSHRIKIVCRDNYGDGYEWVSEIYIYVTSDGNLSQT